MNGMTCAKLYKLLTASRKPKSKPPSRADKLHPNVQSVSVFLGSFVQAVLTAPHQASGTYALKTRHASPSDSGVHSFLMLPRVSARGHDRGSLHPSACVVWA
jgi:hypothetical protein